MLADSRAKAKRRLASKKAAMTRAIVAFCAEKIGEEADHVRASIEIADAIEAAIGEGGDAAGGIPEGANRNAAEEIEWLRREVEKRNEVLRACGKTVRSISNGHHTPQPVSGSLLRKISLVTKVLPPFKPRREADR